ncbi:4-hydroxyphenylacetate 3-monooxygenase, oxygenase component [Metabacillus sp. RGM 3146]|uniref:4-hydroxyphenylacetate 3-monooxygenase, oxygenase component n=1 Tax=Metabacillus sp. RGM 3146 TaxID=3401092 RepID=UPI003B9CAB9B
MPAINGKEYKNRLKKMNPEIWLNGKRVLDITVHPAFKGVIESKAHLYDMQHEEEKTDLLTYKSPLTGQKTGTSFLPPASKEDLEKRRLATQEWAKTNAGLLGRSPEYMNTTIMALGTASDFFKDGDYPFDKHAKEIYERAREKDLCFTHTFITPQVNRSVAYFEDSEDVIAAQVVKKTNNGIVIKGARLLATQGGMTDELLVLPAGGNYIAEPYIYAFCIPADTPGLKFICRESFSYDQSRFNHPLASRFDELDAIVVFDNVEVPWENVFLFQNYSKAMSMFNEMNFNSHVLHQVLSRQVVKTEFILGVAQSLAEAISVDDYLHIKHKISDIILGLESLKALLLASEYHAKHDKRGIMVPDIYSLDVSKLMYTKLYPSFIEILQLIGASGLISLPSEADFQSEISQDLEKYLQSAALPAFERVKVFRLAWDLSMSAFGTRQTHYERFFFGDPVRLATSLYNGYDKTPYVQRVKDFLDI